MRQNQIRGRGLVEGFVKLLHSDRFGQDRHCAGADKAVRRPAANEDDARIRILGHDVAAGGGAVEFRHLIVHEHYVWPMSIVGVDGFQTGADDLHHLVLAKANQLSQRGAHTFLVVGDQDAHTAIAERSMPAEACRNRRSLPVLAEAGYLKVA